MRIDLQELYEWRWTDPENNLVLPYYTRPCLDWLMQQPLEGKNVFEYGVGGSSVWYQAKGANLYGVESSKDWFDTVKLETEDANIELCYDSNKYVRSIIKHPVTFDYIIVDGIERDRCTIQAIQRMAVGTKLILDNWDQPSAYTPSKQVKELVESMNLIIYPQEGHPDWKTLVAWI